MCLGALSQLELRLEFSDAIWVDYRDPTFANVLEICWWNIGILQMAAYIFLSPAMQPGRPPLSSSVSVTTFVVKPKVVDEPKGQRNAPSDSG